jgi:predicted  nucleic acid-binding Zn-ribbon protein
MKQAIGVFAALLTSSSAGKSGEHPIEKIINLLKGLEEQAIAEGKSEALSFQKFEYWCKNSKKTLNKAIAEEKDNIDSLESKIAAKTEESKNLGEQIAKLEEELGEMSTSAKQALAASDKANALYEQVSSDLQSTIDSVGECITAIKDSKDQTSFIAAQQKVSGVIALLETQMSSAQRSGLSHFAKTDPAEVMAAGDMQAHKKSYSFKGGNILELLKQLELKFEDDLTQVEKEETNRVNAYNLAKDARDNAITAATKAKDEKTDLKAEVDEEKSEAEGDLEDEQGELTADTATLDSTDKKCSVKTSEWEERSATRSGEIEAINVAIKILAKVADVRTEAPSNPVPPASPLDFLQVDASDPKMKAVVYLRQKAASLHAKALERLAQEVQARLGGPSTFDAINNDIQKMIFRLMAEQKDEDEHKHWCDLELEKTQVSIDDKQDKMDDLQAKIDDAEAKIGELTEEIKAADDMVAEIVSFMKEATEIREVGKKENDLAIKDAQDSQEAVSNAIAVLTDFYKESGQIAKEPWEFLQKGVELPEDPETWDSSYTAVSDPSAQPGGIITILEKCNEEFATMEADTKAQEASDQDAYDSDMQEHDIEKAKRSKESEMKSAEKKRLVEKAASMEKNRKHVSDEHEATVQYQKDLQPACVEGDSTYEDRKAARTDEIDALHNAQNILEEAFKNMEKGDGFLQKKISKH